MAIPSSNVYSREQVKDQTRQMIYSKLSVEAPRILSAAAIVFIFFIVRATLFVPAYHGIDRTLDFVLAGSFVVIVAGMQTKKIPVSMYPTIMSACFIATTALLCWQYTRNTEGLSLDLSLILFATAGPSIIMRTPAIITLVVMNGIAVAAVAHSGYHHSAEWILVPLAASLASLALMLGRCSTARRLAIASLQINSLAARDSLTGLLNRHGYEQSVPALAALAHRNNEPMFAVFVDVAGLKYVNDTYGHMYGDLLLSRVGEAIRSTARDSDLVMRFGGDEFIIVGIGTEPDPDDFCTRAHAFMNLEGLDGKWRGGCTAGVASGNGVDVWSLIEAADKDMYRRRSEAGHRSRESRYDPTCLPTSG